MIQTLPRSLVVIGIPALVLAFGGAIYAWLRWGEGVFFDTIAGGTSLCL